MVSITQQLTVDLITMLFVLGNRAVVRIHSTSDKILTSNSRYSSNTDVFGP